LLWQERVNAAPAEERQSFAQLLALVRKVVDDLIAAQ
jgi:hypothetical protein